jgi:hypothetical protein
MMPTRSFDFFCTPEELSKALVETLGSSADVSFFVENQKYGWPLKQVRLKDAIVDQSKLLWAEAGSHVPDSFLGLVRIRFPYYRDKALCMSSIAIKTDGDVRGQKRGVQLYERLRKSVRRWLKRGLWGVNIESGGEHFYNDLYVSDGAIHEYQSGWVLMPEAGDGLVRFEYRARDSVR